MCFSRGFWRRLWTQFIAECNQPWDDLATIDRERDRQESIARARREMEQKMLAAREACDRARAECRQVTIERER